MNKKMSDAMSHAGSIYDIARRLEAKLSKKLPELDVIKGLSLEIERLIYANRIHFPETDSWLESTKERLHKKKFQGSPPEPSTHDGDCKKVRDALAGEPIWWNNHGIQAEEITTFIRDLVARRKGSSLEKYLEYLVMLCQGSTSFERTWHAFKKQHGIEPIGSTMRPDQFIKKMWGGEQ